METNGLQSAKAVTLEMVCLTNDRCLARNSETAVKTINHFKFRFSKRTVRCVIAAAVYMVSRSSVHDKL